MCPFVRPSQPLFTHTDTHTPDYSSLCPPQSFRWLIRSLIYPLSDIIVSLHPPHSPRQTSGGLEGRESQRRWPSDTSGRANQLGSKAEEDLQVLTASLRRIPSVGHSSRDAGGGHTHDGRAVGPGSGDGGDGPPAAAEALAEGELPQRLSAGARHRLHDRQKVEPVSLPPNDMKFILQSTSHVQASAVI